MQAVSIARDLLGLPLVNIAGIDIVDGHPKLVLSILWQLMRAHMRRLLQAGPLAMPARQGLLQAPGPLSIWALCTSA